MAAPPPNDAESGLIHLAPGHGVPKRSFLTALVVGSVLTAINQGDVILAGEKPNGVKILLNCLVPFFVATYGAVTARQAALHVTSRD